jgi:hypothetical protein
MAVATDDSYPPFVVVRLLAMGLSGQAAMGYASRIIDEQLGVPLTRRWARMLLEGYGPFASSEDRRFAFRGDPVDVDALLTSTKKARDTVLAKKQSRGSSDLGRRRPDSPVRPNKPR